jgi:hypothetical protein
MKTQLLALAMLAFFFSASASAQSFKIDWDHAPLVKGSVNDVLELEGTLTNLDDKAKLLLFSFNIDDLVDAQTASLCFEFNCFFLWPGEDNPTDRPTQRLDGNGTMRLFASCIPNGVAGTSTIRYNIFDSANVEDSQDVAIVYIAGEVSSVVDASTLGFSVGPTPATDVMTVRGDEANQIIGANIFSFDGTLVRTYSVSAGPSHTFSVNGLSAGSYHLILSTSDGQMVRSAVTVLR